MQAIIKNHAVLRAFIAVIRCEKFTESEIGEAISYYGAKTGRMIGSFPLTQVNFETVEFVEQSIEKFWQKDFEQQFFGGVVFNAGKLANRIASAKVRQKFDVAGVSHFDKDGEIKIPKTCDFFVPVKDGNLIKHFNFYRIEKERIVKI